MPTSPSPSSLVRERDFQQTVILMADTLGWRWYHSYDSRRDPSGFPDLVLVKGDQLLFAELKRDTTYPRADQRAWLSDLAGVQQVHAEVWRPRDLDRIQTLLEGTP